MLPIRTEAKGKRLNAKYYDFLINFASNSYGGKEQTIGMSFFLFQRFEYWTECPSIQIIDFGEILDFHIIPMKLSLDKNMKNYLFQ